MKIMGQGIERVSLIAKDNLEGMILSIISRRIFKDRTEIQLIPGLDKIKEIITPDALEPVKSLLIAGRGLEKTIESELEITCRKKRIRFRYFLNDYKKNLTNYRSTESMTAFLEAFKKYPKIEEEIKLFNPLIESLLESEDFSKRFELVRLMSMIGKKRFIDRFVEDEDIELSEDEKSLVLLESERMERELYRLINSSIDLEIKNKKTRISFSNPNNPVYSDYYLTEILRRDSSVELAIIMELPESMKIKFRNNDISEELVKRFRGTDIGNGLIKSELKSFGVKKVIYEFLRFYGIEMKF